jgi:hypothetical protein
MELQDQYFLTKSAVKFLVTGVAQLGGANCQERKFVEQLPVTRQKSAHVAQAKGSVGGALNF